jgi:hypothetical protein
MPHPDADAFRIWMASLMAMKENEKQDYVGEGGLIVNQMYTVKLGAMEMEREVPNSSG